VTVYRPSARIKLVIRTEEYEDTTDLESRLPSPFEDVPNPADTTGSTPQSATSARSTDPQDRLDRNTERRTELEGRRDGLSPEDYQAQRQRLDEERSEILRDNASSQTEEDASATPPESVSGAARDDLTVVGAIEPQSVQIERNGLTSADTARVTIDYIDAPLDPRIIRSVAIEILIGVVPALEYEDGIERGQRRADGSLTSLVGAADDGTLTGVARFVGFVDEWAVTYSASGDTVELTCRDMTAPLRDMKLNTGESINLNIPIRQGIERLLNSVSPTTRGVDVVFAGAGEGDGPTPSRSTSRRRRPRRGRSNRRARRSNQEMTIWDHITDVLGTLGFIPVMSEYSLIISDPRTLYTTVGATRMVYGRNLEKLDFTRRFTGVKVPTIEARSYDPERGRTLWGRHPVRRGERASGVMGINNPPRPLRANEVPPSGANPAEVVRVITVSGVTDPEVLQRVASTAFEQIGRQEIEGSFTTMDAWSYEREPDESDLLNLVAGDAVNLLIARADSGNDEEVGSSTSLARLEAMETERRASYLESIGWNRTVAQRFAALQSATGFETTFRVQTASISWDNEQGLKIDVGFINFITVREEVDD
jgi:hypothetical protein